MKKIKFILPLMILSVIAAFAFVVKNTDPANQENRPKEAVSKFATTYFVFTGTSTAEYTDSTKWTLHTSPPSDICPVGTNMACKVKSETLSSRTQLVNFIQSNSGVINGQATITATKK